jgi:protein O-mannosyl-transferase
MQPVRAPAAEEDRGRATWRRVVGALALGALVVAVYLPALRNGLVNWDDDIFVVDNAAVSTPAGLRRIWSTVELPEHFPNYPLAFTSYWLEYRLWGLDARGFHATNVVLHGVNTALVFLLMLALDATPWVAGVTAALFGVHPMQVESVAWVAERKNELSAVFFLAAFLAYVRHRTSGAWRWYAVSLLAFVCALLSKTAMVVLPVSILLAERFRIGRWSAGTVGRMVPMFLLAVIAGLLTLSAENRPLSAPLAARPLLAASCLWFYVGKLLVPFGLLPVYPRFAVSPARVAHWLPLLGIVAAIALARRFVTEWQARWGLAHFVCVLLPVIGLRSFGFNEYSFVADRYVYIASIGFFLALALLLARWHRRAGPAVTVLVCVALAGLIALTWRQIAVWRDSVTLWTAVLQGNPDAAVAHNNLGMALIEGGRLAEASSHLQAALTLTPNDPDTHNNLALAFYRQGNFQGAERQCRKAIALAPGAAGFHKNLGLALQAQGNVAAAEGEFRDAVRLEPLPAYRYLLANVLLAQDRPAEALAEYEHVVHSAPTMVEARYNFGLALQRVGRVDEAAQQFEAALRIQPGYTPARVALDAARAHPTENP